MRERKDLTMESMMTSSASPTRISTTYSSKSSSSSSCICSSLTSLPTLTSLKSSLLIFIVILLPSVIDSYTMTTTEGFVSPTNCSRCVLHGEARMRRLEEVKHDILQKLGLKQAPNVTLKELPNIPPLYNFLGSTSASGDPEEEPSIQALDERMSSDMPATSHSEDDYEEFFMNTEKSITFSQNPPKSLNIPKELKVQYFKFSSKVVNSFVTKAHLWVHVRPQNWRVHESDPNGQRKKVAWIIIYQVVRSETNSSPTLLHVKAQKVHINSYEKTWVKVNVKKVVSRWFEKPSDNLGIVIHSYDDDGKELTIGRPNEEGEGSRQDLQMPFIEVKVESYSHSRRRRMVGLNCEEGSDEVRCCRYPLTVDFEEFGWDWIIAPKKYEANYCSGECPFVFLQKYPHTHLVQQASPAGKTGPCCAPRKMSAMSMLYFDDDHTIVHGMLPGMVVERCGCA